MKIECSRQLCAERTDRRTDGQSDTLSSCRSQKSFNSTYNSGRSPVLNLNRHKVHLLRRLHNTQCRAEIWQGYGNFFQKDIFRLRSKVQILAYKLSKQSNVRYMNDSYSHYLITFADGHAGGGGGGGQGDRRLMSISTVLVCISLY